MVAKSSAYSGQMQLVRDDKLELIVTRNGTPPPYGVSPRNVYRHALSILQNLPSRLARIIHREG
jgi:hypothetical protein